MSIGKFLTNDPVVKAIQFDGTVRSATQIIEWVNNSGGEAWRIHTNPNKVEFVIGSDIGNIYAQNQDYIVLNALGEFSRISEYDFKRGYSNG